MASSGSDDDATAFDDSFADTENNNINDATSSYFPSYAHPYIPTYLLVKTSFLFVAHHSTGLLPNGSARLPTNTPPLRQVGLPPSSSPPN